MDLETAEKYYTFARHHADLFSNDPASKVGAIIVDDTSMQILSTGVNGMCHGHADIPERWERPAKYKWVVHAELNAVAGAARVGARLDGATCVVTLFPCANCSKALVQAGIRKVVTVEPDWHHPRWAEDFEAAAQMLRESGVEVVYVPV